MRLGLLRWPGSPQVSRYLLLPLFFLAFALVPRSAWAADDYYTALAKCQVASSVRVSQGVTITAPCAPGSNGSQNFIAYTFKFPNGVSNTEQFIYSGPIPPDANCHANEVVPPGTPYLTSSVTGEACRASDMCQMAFNIGGANSGGYSLTGSICTATGSDFTDGGDVPGAGDPPPPGKPPPETSNPDGSTTFCDQIAGTCVTAAPGAGAPPPSTGDTGDNADNASTSGSSTTTNGATSSTTTTTTSSTTNTTTNTTTTGGGTSGGSGDSTSVGTTTGTTTGTGTSTTDTPASSSSTSSKCTTGVCDVGKADGIMGGMYEPSGETPGTVYARFRASVSASPLVSSVSGFFDTAGIAGSSCPTWHIPGNVYWGLDGFSFDFFCSAGMLQLLALAGMLVLAVGAFSAFRIAIY